MPLSLTTSWSCPRAGTISIDPASPGSSWARAAMASRAFCISSRRYTRLLL
jgi:hypothetical protein